LRYLAAIGLVPQATVEVLDVAPFNGPLRLRVGRSEVSLGRDLAAEVFLSRATAVSLRDT
ncbi:MAG: FeoA family protein, partial [Anaerolineae bacterium]